MLLTANQLDLFSQLEISSVATYRKPVLLMDEKTLKSWKSKISIYQQQVRTREPIQQASLFEIPKSHVEPDAIDPLTISLSSLSFSFKAGLKTG